MNTTPSGRASVRKNAAGQYAGYIGSRKVLDHDGAYNAKVWLASQVLASIDISPSSCFSAEDVEKYKALV